MRRLILALLLGVTAPGAEAQLRDDYEAILVPVYDSGPGAYGSEWTSILRIFNDSDTEASFARPVYIAPCPIAAPCPAPIPPKTAVTYSYFPDQVTGVILWEPKTHRTKLQYQLRIRDASRALFTWGTEIPLVRESEFRGSPLQLLDIPTGVEFRQSLRVYSLSNAPTTAKLRIYDQPEPTHGDIRPEARLLAEADLTIAPPRDLDGEPIFRFRPSFAGIDSVSNRFPEITGASVVRFEIASGSPDSPIWAFVSITNNETQHVTTLTPQ